MTPHKTAKKMHYAYSPLDDTALCGVDIRRGGGTRQENQVECGRCKQLLVADRHRAPRPRKP